MCCGWCRRFGSPFPSHNTFRSCACFTSYFPQILTDPVFTAGLSTYLAAFSYSSTTEDDLFLHLEVATPPLLYLKPLDTCTWPPPGGGPGGRGVAPGGGAGWQSGGNSEALDQPGRAPACYCNVRKAQSLLVGGSIGRSAQLPEGVMCHFPSSGSHGRPSRRSGHV